MKTGTRVQMIPASSRAWFSGCCLLLVSLLVACSPLVGEPTGTPWNPGSGPAAAGRVSVADSLRPEERHRIGQRIWRNECGGTVEGLTSWNAGEGFASLGIGHFIWYPAGMEGPFEESFPGLLRFLAARGMHAPAWLEGSPDCPWRSKAEFDRAFASPHMVALRSYLAATIEGQTAYVVARMEAALPKLLAAVPPGERATVRQRFYAVAASAEGIYALVDYVNFKGEGIRATERYRGQGWGLLQVLQGMQPSPGGTAAAREFGRSATRVLTRRVANAPRDESRWLAGWKNRCATYGKPL